MRRSRRPEPDHAPASETPVTLFDPLQDVGETTSLSDGYLQEEPTAGRARITLISFGFKYGHPGTNHYFDVSFLRNPAREECWDLFSRPSPAMREFVLDQPACRAFLERVIPLLKVLMQCDDDVRVGIGCSAGRHRSALVAEEIRSRLQAESVTVKLIHREEAFQ